MHRDVVQAVHGAAIRTRSQVSVRVGEIVAQKDYFLAAAKRYPSGSRSSGETIRVAPAASSPFNPRSTVTSTSNAADSTGSAVWRDAAEAQQWLLRS